MSSALMLKSSNPPGTRSKCPKKRQHARALHHCIIPARRKRAKESNLDQTECAGQKLITKLQNRNACPSEIESTVAFKDKKISANNWQSREAKRSRK
mmetsp:Transcript_24803/g.51858  ORF Transcript_24803/g.51858 Transcript_24803/m.51858 type:complete len:97 (-) Transcript_24803:102-392(-)